MANRTAYVNQYTDALSIFLHAYETMHGLRSQYDAENYASILVDGDIPAGYPFAAADFKNLVAAIDNLMSAGVGTTLYKCKRQ